MNIAIIAAAGKAGSRIMAEAVRRGHRVTAIVRHPDKLQQIVPVVQKGVLDLTVDDLNAFDVVVNALAASAGNETLHVTAGRHLIAALTETNVRLIVIGGAGSLYSDASKKTLLKDEIGFPAVFYPTAANQAKNLEDLRASRQLKWTFVSPSAIFAIGKRTGHYKTGKDVLLTNASGRSYVSYEDFAIAIIDEIENPQHIKKRFTVVSASE
ncbi:MAG: NAD(P)-dependent oxidoreductase [Sporolactobacillus sp.]